jgi:uncharacterized protein
MISQLKEGENKLHFDSGRDVWVKEVIQRVEQQGYKFETPLSVDGNLVKLEPDYYLKGNLRCTVQHTCGRCAESFPLVLDSNFDIAFAHVKHDRAKTARLTDESDEIDINFFEGNEIDLGPVLEEQFFLGIPYQAICTATCKGLCQRCGTNLNAGNCECRGGNPVSPFSVLKNIKASV